MTLTNRALILLLAIIVSSCGSSGVDNAGEIASTPLDDLNIGGKDIPVALQSALADPYGMPPDTNCQSLDAMIADLDSVLAPDIDAAEDQPDGVGKKMGNAAAGALKSTAEDIIPFRSWVRKLTGAEKRSRKTASAIGAGIVRRAFLKGVRAANQCES